MKTTNIGKIKFILHILQTFIKFYEEFYLIKQQLRN